MRTSRGSAAAAVAVAIATLALTCGVSAQAPDCPAQPDQQTCLAAGGRPDDGCSYCIATPPGSVTECVTNAQAAQLQPSEFTCSNASTTVCDPIEDLGVCEKVQGCYWCSSRTVGPKCANYMNQSSLPKSVFTCVGPYAESGPAAVGSASEPYDFFMLVMQWAITECQDVFTCTPSPTNNFFTLHGLWPENNDGSYPQNCAGAAFDPAALTPLLPLLNRFWPSLNGPSETFWQHEFEKHGRCADDVFHTQVDFFNSTLSYLAKYNITEALAAGGIVPSNTVSFQLTDFNAALTAAFSTSALLTCDAQHRVETATLCIGKDGLVMACPSAVPRKCSGGLAFLPASMPAPTGLRGQGQ